MWLAIAVSQQYHHTSPSEEPWDPVLEKEARKDWESVKPQLSEVNQPSVVQRNIRRAPAMRSCCQGIRQQSHCWGSHFVFGMSKALL